MDDWYVSEDGGEVYVRATTGWNAARHIASDAVLEIGDKWSRSRYVGKRDVPLHDHCDWESCTDCPAVPVYVFEQYEGTYRG